MSGPSLPTVKRLFAMSGNRCAFPKCSTPLVDQSGNVTARICHIRARKSGGSRYDDTQTDTQRHAFSNLLLLCPNHHDTVDVDVNAYPVTRLSEMKNAHESSAVRLPEPSDDTAMQFIANLEVSGPGATVVTSYNQSGGITAGNVNINAAPEPTLRQTQLFANKPANGGYHTRYEFQVESPYPPGNLYVEVHAPSIRSAELNPQRAGMVFKGHSGTRPGFAFDNLQQPYGRILLDVYTGDPENLQPEWKMQ